MATLKICEITDCGKHVRAKGLCAMHHQRVRRHGNPHGGGSKPAVAGRFRALACAVQDCGQPHQSLGYCATHYQRHRTGRSLEAAVVPRRHGQEWVDRLGYVYFTERGHPEANRFGRVHQHRAVMAAKLGRKLLPGENVHHINGDRADNRPENLELWVSSQPSGQRPEDLLEWAQEIIRRYG